MPLLDLDQKRWQTASKHRCTTPPDRHLMTLDIDLYEIDLHFWPDLVVQSYRCDRNSFDFNSLYSIEPMGEA
jgi:hypothetical protein